MLAVIGGSGIYQLDANLPVETITVETPFGQPSGAVSRVQIGNSSVLFLARHGPGHVFSPTSVPYRANVFALKKLGATHLIALSAVGSLREEIAPRSLVTPGQIIDRTVSRQRSFFESGIVAHVGIADPVCGHLRMHLANAANRVTSQMFADGTYVCIEGPQFSTRAESNLYRSWNATIIGMTAMPEARLAREAGLCYAILAMVTDYDVWHDSEEDVSVEVVMANLRANSDAARAIVRNLAENELPDRSCACASALQNAIMTTPDRIPVEAQLWIDTLEGDQSGRS